MGEKLKNPPLIEALCEFRHISPAAWDWTIPGQLFGRIRSDFPKRSEVKLLGIEIKPGSGIASAAVRTAPERVQFARADGSAMVQVGPGVLVVNQLRPYDAWESFRALIVKTHAQYRSLGEFPAFDRIGLRYINRMPASQGRWSDLITVSPAFPREIGSPLLSFHQRYELAIENPSGTLIHQTGTVQDESGVHVMLDLDFGSDRLQGVGGDQGVEAWLDGAHHQIERAFLASLNPKYYESLRGVR
jgi:uncharacterized protein (TIGR04255 family)